MANSSIEIVNYSFSLIGQLPITAFGDGTRAANEANLKYPLVRDNLLRRHEWSFATKRKKLVKDAVDPEFGYVNQFILPMADMLRPLSFTERSQNRGIYDHPSRFEIEGDRLLTDRSEVFLRYVFRNENVTQYPADFVSALAAALAMEYSFAITGSQTVFTNLSALADRYLRTARSNDGKVKGSRLPSVEFTDVRRQSRSLGFS